MDDNKYIIPDFQADYLQLEKIIPIQNDLLNNEYLDIYPDIESIKPRRESIVIRLNH